MQMHSAPNSDCCGDKESFLFLFSLCFHVGEFSAVFSLSCGVEPV